MRFTRRRFVQAAAASSLGISLGVKAQAGPLLLGLMTVKTGPNGAHNLDRATVRALQQYLQEKNNTMAGRKVELFVADGGGTPAQTRTKIQELVERDKINVMIGPLDTASALAADDYIRQAYLGVA